VLGRDDGRKQPRRRRAEEPGRRARHPGEHRDDPDRRRPRDQQRREQPLGGDAREVGDHHHRAAGDPVRHHAADQHRGHERQRPRGEHDPDVRRRPAELEHREGERDVHHPVAEHRHRERPEHEPEVALPQNREALRQSAHEPRRLPVSLPWSAATVEEPPQA
jgi:hypothetical protein